MFTNHFDLFSLYHHLLLSSLLVFCTGSSLPTQWFFTVGPFPLILQLPHTLYPMLSVFIFFTGVSFIPFLLLLCVCVRQLGKKLLNMVELHKNRNVCSPKTTINFINLWNGQKCTSKWNRTIARSLCVFHFYDLSSVQGSLLGIFSWLCVFTFGSLLVSRCINFRWRYASTQKKTTFKRTLYRMERRGRVHTHTQAATKKSSKWFHCIELVLWKLL